MKYFHNNADSDVVIPVKVNGVEYPTKIYKGVQRFVPNEAVFAFVQNNIEAGNWGPYTLNELAHDVVTQKIPLSEYITFLTLTGYSVSGFCEVMESTVGFNDHIFTGNLEDYFVIENPLWQD